MTNQDLDNIIRSTCNLTEGALGHWKFEINEVGFMCMTDENFNRMRIISPIIKLDDIGEQELLECMEANFHTALDARYATSDGVLWAAFIHPLNELTEAQVMDAISQVHSCVKTFGNSYTSGNLIFPKSDENS